MVKLVDLINEREAIKHDLDVVEMTIADQAANPIDQPMVIQLMTMTDEAKIKLQEVQRKIQHIHPAPADLADHVTEYKRLLTLSMRFHSQLHGIKAKLPVAPAPPPINQVPQVQDIRLPRLELPKFTGSITDWLSFRDMFENAVNSNTHLSKSQKFTYLKSLVQGDAARQIHSMVISDANYDIAWANLKDRYNNDRELMFAIIRRLINHTSMQQQSSSSLRSLIDVSKECRRSLAVLGIPLDKGLDAFFIFHIFNKLDQGTREHWEQSLKTSAIPELDDFLEFLEQRARALAAGTSVRPSSRPPAVKEEPYRRHQVHHTQATTKSCKFCSQPYHPLYKCQKFLSASVLERLEATKKSNICQNCLTHGHLTSNCSSQGRCRQCQQRHNTLLHKEESASSSNQELPSPRLNMHLCGTQFTKSLLATAQVRVLNGPRQAICRSLMDNGSEDNFITEGLCNMLQFKRIRINAEVTGLSSTSVATARWAALVRITPHFQSHLQYEFTAIVVNSITGMLPTQRFNANGMSHLQDITLADPTFHTPSNVDLLLGSDLFWETLMPGQRNGNPHQPKAFESKLGWLVAGRSNGRRSTIRVHVAVSNSELDAQLQRFWEIEDCNTSVKRMSPEEIYAENHFKDTHSRGENGTFSIAIPWKEPKLTLGSTLDTARRRFYQLERRLENDKSHYQDYVKFMRDYQSLGHMEEVPPEEYIDSLHPTSFIPHHFVLKLDSTTTKFRVVFDASCKSSNGTSLNDTMCVGPVLQDTMTDILTRFRCHPFAFTADIQKMYRQIRLRPEDIDRHRIFWREKPSDPLKQFRLLTVTYGTGSAPYLATKCLQQLAIDEQSSLPKGSNAALNDFYVDDLLSGSLSLEDAIQLQDEIIELTKRGGFPLRKFSSNCPELINRIPLEFRENPTPQATSNNETTLQLPIADGNPKTLGLIWNTEEDTFKFKYYATDDTSVPVTKRNVASDIAKLFDPLGWAAPVIIKAKIFLQTLWKLSTTWDEELPLLQQEEWQHFKSSLKSITLLSVPRCILQSNPVHVSLAGFSDASEKAYAAVTYLCTYYDNKPAIISLISSKTRVAPVKQLSLPRLELCGAHLLSLLMSSNLTCLKRPIDSIRCWSDSTIVLSWLSSPSSRWKTYVANRVSEVQTNLPEASWNHIPGKLNPADCASRGLTPAELQNHAMWWNGPELLKQLPTSNESEVFNDPEALVEERTVSLHTSRAVPSLVINLLLRFSSLTRLQRVTAWVFRFLYNRKNKSTPRQGTLSVKELKSSLNYWIRITQYEAFSDELYSLKENHELRRTSALITLNPFIDEHGILRVGGRLRKSSLPYNNKHPVLLPSKSHLTRLIVINTHLNNLHAGPQLVLSVLFQQYWIIRGRDTVRNLIKKCVTCRRNAPVLQQQMMSDLPSARVTAVRPFQRCGVDYAGPFTLRPIPPRAKTTFKAYLALFVCLSTKAIHVEVVCSLSTESFIAALRRFSSRRGRPSDIYSDQGTNFIGADKELRKLLKQSTNYNTVSDQLSTEGTQWHFNPPGAPHFGGLWEAGVKSVKFHLHRVIGSTVLNLEEMTTITTQIEAILNSRPLTAQSTDPGDYTVLTPGHFLIGSPQFAVPDPNLSHEKIGRLSRWQLLQKINQDFWHRWSSEYLTRMQQRPKWQNMRNNVEINDLVIIKDDNLPPQRWKLGRIIETHPGTDQLVRVVSIRTAESILKRPVTKLCILPVHDKD